ncbi:MAG: AMP-binding protein [Fluviicola sp.]|nr:AMP-binding protein [Fluviicola sp.]
MNLNDKNIVSLFLSAAKEHPENTAIIEGETSISYAELRLEVLQTAAYFKIKGIQQGDRVLVFVPMGINLYRIVLALFYIGATAVFLDEWVSKKRMEICCEIADCKGFIGVTKARIFSFFSKELRKIPVKLSLKKRLNETVNIAEINKESSALITFTTGSTGLPKAADRSHLFLHEQFKALINEIDPKSTDIDMPVLPIVLFVNLGVGCCSVIADFKMTKPELMDSEKIATQIKSNEVTRITASPYFVKMLANHVLQSKTQLPKVEKIFTGGAPVFPDEADLYNKAFPDSKTTIVYGSTEAEPISSIDSKELAKNNQLSVGLPVGTPYHKTDLVIIKISEEAMPNLSEDEFKKMQVKDGEIGEILVSGPHVLKKYFNNDEAFKQNKIIVNQTIWHRTGDSGTILSKELFLTGRCQQLIKINDTYFSPFIAESKLQNTDGIDCGTILSSDGNLILIVQSSLSKTELEERIQDLDYSKILILDKIPKDPRHNSKIDYESLRKLTHIIHTRV